MDILWSNQAQKAFGDIRDYLFTHFGIEAEESYLNKVDDTLAQIVKFPNVGVPVYQLSADGTVRSFLIKGLSKFIYYVRDNTIYIADVWDVRQDPDVLLERFT